MNLSSLRTIEQIQTFLAGTSDVRFASPGDELARRTFVEGVLRHFSYLCLPRKQRGVLYRYLQQVCGYSRQHLDRLIARHREHKSLRPQTRSSRTSFTRKFNDAFGGFTRTRVESMSIGKSPSFWKSCVSNSPAHAHARPMTTRWP
ncbi:MAG: hypothetical protein ACYCP0_06505, partial [Acidiferrobacteraceae bacterium]